MKAQGVATILNDDFSPDLQVVNVQAPSNAVAGQLIVVNWTLTNSSTEVATGQWTDRLWFSQDNQVGGDISVGAFPISDFVAHDRTITRIQNVMAPPNLSGQYWLIVQANSDQGIPEVNTTNNFTVSAHPILITRPPFPNLRVASVAAPLSAFAGQETMVEWVVTNAGTKTTGSDQWRDAVYLSPDVQWDTSDTFLGAVPNPSFLGVGDSYLSSAIITIPRRIQGLYYIIIRTDYQNRVNEGGLEGDNTGASLAIPITLPPPPDLRVATVFAPYDAFSGQPVTITWAVTNVGGGATDEAYWEDAIYLSTGSNLTANAVALGGFAHSGAMASGQFYTNSQQVTLPVGISGTNYYFLVQTDYRNHAWEWVFENNNFGAATHATEIHLTPPPDLELTSVTTASNVCAGFDLAVNYRVANNGANNTPNYSWQDAIYLSADTNFDAQVDTYARLRFSLRPTPAHELL